MSIFIFYSNTNEIMVSIFFNGIISYMVTNVKKFGIQTSYYTCKKIHAFSQIDDLIVS